MVFIFLCLWLSLLNKIVWSVTNVLEKYVIKIPSFNLSFSKEFETLIQNENWNRPSASFTFQGEYIKYVGGGWRILQIFQKIFRSPGDDRPKYFMVR